MGLKDLERMRQEDKDALRKEDDMEERIRGLRKETNKDRRSGRNPKAKRWKIDTEEIETDLGCANMVMSYFYVI